jgi:hypothetical protein
LKNYGAHREDMAGKSRERSKAGREIAPIPPVVNPKRKSKAAKSLRFFCETYLSAKFYLGWSIDHLTALGKCQSAIDGGGCFAVGMPRGSGKTTICIAAALWGVLTGRRRFIACVGSDAGAAEDILDAIKSEIECNELLLEDFPEVCYPVRRLDGIAQRANGQILNGERTHITWEKTELVIPTVKGSKSSGAAVYVAGITGKIRGMFAVDATGRSFRPDVAIIDDPQTDESAHSESQCRTRTRTIDGAITGLAGPDSSITLLMPCTVIVEGDLADTYLDREKRPAWKGERFKICYSLPSNEKLWNEYAEIRKTEQKESDDHTTPKANRFYRKHKKAMDEGCRPAWIHRKKPDEVSAIQHLMNLKLDNEMAFWAEYMNEPKREDDGRDPIKADAIASKTNGYGRRIVPESATRLTAFIDVMGKALYYVVVAWEENFTGYIVDYGTWPDQREAWFQLKDIRRTIAKALRQDDLEGGIYRALETLVDLLLVDWRRTDDSIASLDRIVIDANWGPTSEVVYRFCQRSPHKRLLTPSHGRYVRAASREFLIFRPKPGDRSGVKWRMPKPAPKRVRHLLYDTNHWKSFVFTRLAVPIGQATALSLWGDDPTAHELFASHMTAEYPTVVEADGRTVEEWQQRPERPDNHWLDGVVGCAVAASVEGLSPLGPLPKKVKKKRIRLSEMMGAI